RRSGVPASSQSTPARIARAAVSRASSMSVRSREIWTTGFMGAASKPEQGMVSPLERQRHARPAAAMGFEHGHRHLDDGASVPGGAERLAVFDDGGDQV